MYREKRQRRRLCAFDDTLLHRTICSFNLEGNTDTSHPYVVLFHQEDSGNGTVMTKSNADGSGDNV